MTTPRSSPAHSSPADPDPASPVVNPTSPISPPRPDPSAAPARDLGQVISALSRVLAADAPALAPGATVLSHAGETLHDAHTLAADVQAEFAGPVSDASQPSTATPDVTNPLALSDDGTLARLVTVLAKDASQTEAASTLVSRLDAYKAGAGQLRDDLKRELGADVDIDEETVQRALHALTHTTPSDVTSTLRRVDIPDITNPLALNGDDTLARLATVLAKDVPQTAVASTLLSRLDAYKADAGQLHDDLRRELGADVNIDEETVQRALHTLANTTPGNLASTLRHVDTDRELARVQEGIKSGAADDALARAGDVAMRLASVVANDTPVLSQGATALAHLGGVLSGAGRLGRDVRAELGSSLPAGEQSLLGEHIPRASNGQPHGSGEQHQHQQEPSSSASPPSEPRSTLQRGADTLARLASAVQADAPSSIGAAAAREIAHVSNFLAGAGKLESEVRGALGEEGRGAIEEGGKGLLAGFMHLARGHDDNHAGDAHPTATASDSFSGRLGALLHSHSHSQAHGHATETEQEGLPRIIETSPTASDVPHASGPPHTRPPPHQRASTISESDVNRDLPALPTPAARPPNKSSHRSAPVQTRRSYSPPRRSYSPRDIPGAESLGRDGMPTRSPPLSPRAGAGNGRRALSEQQQYARPRGVSWSEEEDQDAQRARKFLSAPVENGRGGGGGPPGGDSLGDLMYVPKEKKRRLTVAERLETTIAEADRECKKARRIARRNSRALNVAIGLQVLFGALTTGLGASLTGSGSSVTISILGGASTVVASYLAKARSSGEPEASGARVKVLDHFLREIRAFALDHGHETEDRDEVGWFRQELEILLGKIKPQTVEKGLGQSPQWAPAPGTSAWGTNSTYGPPSGLGGEVYGAHGVPGGFGHGVGLPMYHGAPGSAAGFGSLPAHATGAGSGWGSVVGVGAGPTSPPLATPPSMLRMHTAPATMMDHTPVAAAAAGPGVVGPGPGIFSPRVVGSPMQTPGAQIPVVYSTAPYPNIQPVVHASTVQSPGAENASVQSPGVPGSSWPH